MSDLERVVMWHSFSIGGDSAETSRMLTEAQELASIADVEDALPASNRIGCMPEWLKAGRKVTG